MIVVEELGKSFGNLVAVDNLNFEIQAGETFGLLGPNGAGKSTTISMIVGLLQPDRGTIQIQSSKPGSPAGPPNDVHIRRRIGISPQSLSLYEELTAQENLGFFGGLYGLGGAALKKRIGWALDFSGLNDRKTDRVTTYSGGMKRRLNIAVALMHEPEILLLDEPTVGVDPQSRNHIFESIEQLQDSGLTVIYTTHYMEEAQRLCDRVAIVDHGKLLALDPVDQLIASHGGQSTVTAEVSGATDISSVDSHSIQNVQQEKNQIRFTSDRPLEAVAELTSQGLRFDTLNLARPDLESVFLSLTGRRLRD